jgi:N utilization substance protein B
MKERREARKTALIVLYQYETGLRDTVSETFKYSISINPINKKEVYEYTEKLLLGIEKKWDFLNEKIEGYSRGWALNRILIINRNILRIALYEMFFLKDVPIKVSINEAVELAKIYSDNKARVFINGILDRIFKKEFNGKDRFMHNSR